MKKNVYKFDEFLNESNSVEKDNNVYDSIYDFDSGRLSLLKYVHSPFKADGENLEMTIDIQIYFNSIIINKSSSFIVEDIKKQDYRLYDLFFGFESFFIDMIGKEYTKNEYLYSKVGEFIKYLVEQCNYKLNNMGCTDNLYNLFHPYIDNQELEMERIAEMLVVEYNMSSKLIVDEFKKVKDYKKLADALYYAIKEYDMQGRYREVVNEIDDKDILLKIPLPIENKISIHNYHKVNPDDLDDLDSYEF